MIVGNGDIGSVLPDRDLLYFASGVSNSQETDDAKYYRELLLLRNQPKSAHLVYFSTLALFYSDTRYTRHKKMMEQIIKRDFRRYTIIRLGNITFGGNPNTIVNFFKNKIKNGEKFEVQDTYRYLIDKDEFLYWIDMIPSFSCEMNCPGRRIKVQQIVDEIKEGKL